jgi:hypothetical protein
MKSSFPIAAGVVAILAGLSSIALAQTAQPYSGMQSRPIKALSDQQVADLKAGRGMGLALAAELNGYPGPSHLVELSDQLALTAEQLSSLKGMLDAMKAETIPIGNNLVAEEQELDRLFAENVISEQQLKAADHRRDPGAPAQRALALPSAGARDPPALSNTPLRRTEGIRRRASGSGAPQAQSGMNC